LIKRIINSSILVTIFIPLLYLIVVLFLGVFKENSETIIQVFSSYKLVNSLLLATLVALISTAISLFIAILFYHLRDNILRIILLLTLFFLFAIAPIIYTSLLSQLSFFIFLSPLIKSILVLTLWISPLASGIMILMMAYIDKSSLEILKFLPLRSFNIFKDIIVKQLLFSLFAIFTLVFMMIFIQEEVPSFFGYRTYAEEFLSRIILMEEFESTLLYSLPFVLFSFVSSLLFYFLSKYNDKKTFENGIIYLDKLKFIKSKILPYFAVLIFLLILFFIIFSLLSKIDFSSFTTLLDENISILLNSFVLASLASIIATTLSIYFIKYFNNYLHITILISFSSLYWFLPSSLTALVIIKFSQIFYIDSEIYSYLMLLYAYVLRVLPIGLVMIFILSKEYDSNHFFKLVKISKWNLFFKIVLPQQYKGWLLVFAILFFLVLNEITTTILLVPAGFETLILKIYNLLHYGDFNTVAFLSLLQIVVILFSIFLFILGRVNYDKT